MEKWQKDLHMMSKYSVVSIVQKFKKTGSVTNKHGGIYITI